MKTIPNLFDIVEPGKPIITTPEELNGVPLSSIPVGVNVIVKRDTHILDMEHKDPWLRVRVLAEHSLSGGVLESGAVSNINELAVARAWEIHPAFSPAGDEYKITPEPIVAFHIDDQAGIEAVTQKADSAIQVILMTARELLTKAAHSLNLRSPEAKEAQPTAA